MPTKRRTASRQSRPRRKAGAPAPLHPPSRPVPAAPGGDGWLLRLIFILCLVLAAAVAVGLFLNSHRPVQVSPPAASQALPPARSTLPAEAPAQPEAPTPAATTAPAAHEPERRAADAAYQPPAAPSREFQLSSGKDLGFRARRSASQGVEVRIFNSSYKSVRVLSQDKGSPAAVKLTWDGKDDQGQAVDPGTYFARITQPSSETIEQIEVK